MPLTIAHPAAVLPFRRWGLPLSALVIGSASPDFEYFLRLEPIGHFAHSIAGLFLFCLPMGLLACAVYHAVVAPVLPGYLLRPLRTRYSPGEGLGWPQAPSTMLAILVGAATHVCWDSFTHRGSYVVDAIPLLQQPLFGWPVYKYLQHGSTITGLAILAWWTVQQPIVDRVKPQPRRFEFTMGLTVVFILLLGILGAINLPLTLGRLVVMVIDAGLLAVVLVCLWKRLTVSRDAGMST